MLPVFVFMTVVDIIRPTPSMYFFGCKEQGETIGFKKTSKGYMYRVRLECSHQTERAEWFREEDLKRVAP